MRKGQSRHQGYARHRGIEVVFRVADNHRISGQFFILQSLQVAKADHPAGFHCL